MAVVSIDLQLMQDVINMLDDVLAQMPRCVARINSNLDNVMLSYPDLNKWRDGGGSWWEIKDLRDTLAKHLQMAQDLANSKPSIGVTVIPAGFDIGTNSEDYVVSFDDTIEGTDAAQAAADITQMVKGKYDLSNGIPEDLLALLTEGSHDPDFAAQFAQLVSPDTLADLARQCNIIWGNLQTSDGDASTFEMHYSQLLTGLGQTMSLGYSTMPSDSPSRQQMLSQWQDVFSTYAKGDPALAPQFLSMIIARGQWPDDFLTGITSAIQSAEGPMGASYWATFDMSTNPATPMPVFDPGVTGPDGQPVAVADPMFGIWSAAAYNPQWFLNMYQSGGLADIQYDSPHGDQHDLSTQVDTVLHDMLTKRGVDEASFTALLQTASVADTWRYLHGGGTSNAAAQVIDIAGEMARNQRLYDEEPWWDKYGHLVLEGIESVTAIAAMATGVGTPFGVVLLTTAVTAGAVDIAWYGADGNIGAAVFNTVMLVLVVVDGIARLVPISMADAQILKDGGQVAVGDSVLALDVNGTPVMLTRAEALDQPWQDGVVNDQVNPQMITDLRTKWNVPERDTVAVGKTDIPGLEGFRFEGGSIQVRREAGLPSLTESGSSAISAPRDFPSWSLDNGEGDVLAKVDDAIAATGQSPQDVEGTLNIIQSNPDGVCGFCRAGLPENSTAQSDGVIKQFSDKYPGVEIDIYTLNDDGTTSLATSVIDGHYK